MVLRQILLAASLCAVIAGSSNPSQTLASDTTAINAKLEALFLSAEKYLNQTQIMDLHQILALNLSVLYKKMGYYKKALQYQKDLKMLSDTLLNKENLQGFHLFNNCSKEDQLKIQL